MELLTGESILLTSNDQKLILTNQRIQMTDTLGTKSFTNIIFLENISSVVTHYKGHMPLLVIAASFGILGLAAIAFGVANLAAGIFLILGALGLILWWSTVTQVVTIVSDSGNKIHFAVGEMSKDKIEGFTHSLQMARQNRRQVVQPYAT